MYGPDKGNYPNECEFIKIEKPSLIAWKRYSMPLFQVFATFEETADNQTRGLFLKCFLTRQRSAEK
jgi:hypothetical protein